MNYSTQIESFRSRFFQALNRPLQNRCAELTVLIDRGNMNDLQQMFPLLIDDIFKPNSGFSSWQLRTLANSCYSQDFQALQHFFSPFGPMFKLIYSLLKDPNIKFPFNLSFLPSRVRSSIFGQNKHPFYVDLVQTDAQSNNIMSLMLNPFDYYIFHFAYHLINPLAQPINAAWNTVYYILCCDYILYFLPTQPDKSIMPILDYYSGKNPTYTLPSFNQSPNISRLLRSDTVTINKLQNHEHHPRNKIWRSETIITVFIDLWLNNDQVLASSNSFDKSYLSMQQKFKVNELPTGEYIRIVRVLVKQLHAFGSSANSDDSPMGELKKIVIPYLQGRIYIFLRHLIHQWPLDGSFRLVLELWVSFLQPWRYPGSIYKKNPAIREINPDADDLTLTPMNEVDHIYINFIAENLLCYTVLLQQLLPRFTRVDLSSPKLALILFRLLKVFSQPNLVTYLREIESTVGCVTSSPVHSFNNSTVNQTTLPPLSPTSIWSSNLNQTQLETGNYRNEESSCFTGNNTGKWAVLIKQKILEYEGPNFTYKPIFSTTTAPEIYELFRHIKLSWGMAEIIYQRKQQESMRFSSGFFEMLKSLFVAPEKYIDEFTLEERKRVSNLLSFCCDHLRTMFYIDNQHVDSFDMQTSLPRSQNDINLYLTPRQVRQRVLKSKFEGNPDLVSIRSDEVEILVKLLHELAVKANERYSSQINEMYHCQSFTGALTRQLVQPPCTIYKYDKFNSDVSPQRIAERLPARLSFRYFASYRFLSYFTFTVIISYIFGYGYLTFSNLMFCFWFLYVCIKAAFNRCHRGERVQSNETTSDPMSSFNDSFN